MYSDTLTAAEVRDTVINVWSKCQFGVKNQWKKKNSRRVIEYILGTPTYGKIDVMLDVIKTLKDEALLHQQHVEIMNSAIAKEIEKLNTP